MLELKNVNLYLKRDDRVLAENFSFTLARGDKAVLMGEEGNGKSTLLKAVYDRSLVEDYCDFTGEVTARGKMAYLPQMLPEEDKDRSVAEFFDGAEVYRQTELLNRLGIAPGFLDSPRRLGTLSGGEKVRCMLSRMMLSGANFLVLDQPTNHLDLESIAALNNGLEAFKYNVIFSCHDHQLTQTVANRIIEIREDGSIADRLCTYDEYMQIHTEA